MKSIKSALAEFSETNISPETQLTCECGNKYFEIRLKGKEYDPGKCKECVRKDIEREDAEIIKRANTFLNRKEIAKYDSFCEIPPGCESATFNNYQPQNKTQEIALEKSIEFVKNIDLNSNHSIMFQGTPGIGKSHLSVSIHKALREQDIPTLIIDSPSFFQTLRSYFNYPDHAGAQEKLLRTLKDVDVLIFDDIGAEYVKETNSESWASDIMYQIMNARQTKVNVFSTNYKSKELLNKYGSLSSRIISRMLAGADVIQIEGKDKRIRGFK